MALLTVVDCSRKAERLSTGTGGLPSSKEWWFKCDHQALINEDVHIQIHTAASAQAVLSPDLSLTGKTRCPDASTRL